MKCKKLVRAMIAFVVAGSMSITVNATSISDLKDQKDQKESKKAEAEAVLEQLQSEQKSILDAIEELDAQVTEYTNQITELEGRQTQLESDIEQKQTELAAAQEKEQQQYEAMKERIRYSYENGNPSYLDVLFSTSDISDIVNQTEYADQILPQPIRRLQPQRKLIDSSRQPQQRPQLREAEVQHQRQPMLMLHTRAEVCNGRYHPVERSLPNLDRERAPEVLVQDIIRDWILDVRQVRRL